MWICDRKLYRTKAGLIVEEGDPQAFVLLFRPGDKLAVEPLIAGKKPSRKAARPPENKARKAAEDK